MGDRYWLQLKCAECGAENPSKKDYDEDPMENGIYYAPSSGFMSFVCSGCKKINLILGTYKTKIASKEEETEFYKLNGFE